MRRQAHNFSIIVVLLAGNAILGSCIQHHNARRATDKNFVLMESEPSPDGQHMRLVYMFDHGGLGYSRVWWAVLPINYEEFDLARFELPDCYKATGWSDSGSLIVEKWKPYYYPDKDVDLKTGDIVHGVRIQLSRRSAAE